MSVQIHVYSRPIVESVAPPESPHVFISITSRIDDLARLPTNGKTLGVLRQTFADRDAGADLFTSAQAEQIAEFVTKHAVETIVVHCDAGRSRSAAVAAALGKIMNGDDTEFFRRYTPNMHVYRTLLEALEKSRETEGPR